MTLIILPVRLRPSSTCDSPIPGASSRCDGLRGNYYVRIVARRTEDRSVPRCSQHGESQITGVRRRMPQAKPSFARIPFGSESMTAPSAERTTRLGLLNATAAAKVSCRIMHGLREKCGRIRGFLRPEAEHCSRADGTCSMTLGPDLIQSSWLSGSDYEVWIDEVKLHRCDRLTTRFSGSSVSCGTRTTYVLCCHSVRLTAIPYLAWESILSLLTCGP